MNHFHLNHSYRITARLLLYMWRELLRTLKVPGLFSTVKLSILSDNICLVSHSHQEITGRYLELRLRLHLTKSFSSNCLSISKPRCSKTQLISESAVLHFLTKVGAVQTMKFLFIRVSCSEVPLIFQKHISIFFRYCLKIKDRASCLCRTTDKIFIIYCHLFCKSTSSPFAQIIRTYYTTILSCLAAVDITYFNKIVIRGSDSQRERGSPLWTHEIFFREST